jgi:hypothetical protein
VSSVRVEKIYSKIPVKIQITAVVVLLLLISDVDDAAAAVNGLVSHWNTFIYARPRVGTQTRETC